MVQGYHNSKTEPGKRDFYCTPEYLRSYIKARWSISIDLAASGHNSIVPDHIDAEADSLQQPWHLNPGVGFCNPPYSNIDPFIEKAIKESRKGFTTVMLIPTPNGDKRDSRIFEYASRLIFIIGRVSFMQDDQPVKGNTRGSVLIEFKGHDHLEHTREPLKVSYVYRNDLEKRYEKIFFDHVPF